MFLVTNRYTVHITMFVIAGLIIFLNVRTTEVRAETFGEKSLLYSLVTEQDNTLIEEYAGDIQDIFVTPVAYRENAALSSIARGIDFIEVDQLSGGTLGVGIISNSNTIKDAPSVTSRDKVEIYAVQAGDTLSTIAGKFDITLNTLLWSNNLTVRSVLQPGNSLTILPVSGVEHTVKRGDTLGAIAKKYDIESTEILAFNGLDDGNSLSIGDNLIIPGGTVSAPAPAKRSSTIGSVFTSAPKTRAPASTATSGSGAMIWPTDLRVITQYFGWRHTGIDIDCYNNNDNYASDDGIVEFAGWKGDYGYTVDVNHGNGLVTRYAHNAKLYVVKGESVAKGQSVALCGTTGRSTGTHIHFEVISGGRFKNPLEYVR